MVKEMANNDLDDYKTSNYEPYVEANKGIDNVDETQKSDLDDKITSGNGLYEIDDKGIGNVDERQSNSRKIATVNK